MHNEPSSSPATTPTSRRSGRLLAVLLSILGLAYLSFPLLSRFLAAPYVVTAGKARYYPNRPWGIHPGPLTLDIDVECNRRRPIPYCEVVVDSISDNAGNDLLAGPLDVKPYGANPPSSRRSYSGKQGGNSIYGSGNKWEGSAEIHRFTWNIEVPQLPRPDIKSIHLTGHIGLWEGGEQRQIRIPDVAFKAGTTFQIDGLTAEIVDFIEAGKGNDSGTCYFMIRDDGLFFERVECQSADGSTKVEDSLSRDALPRWPDEPSKGFVFSFSTPSGATRGDVTFHCRINSQYQILPLDLHYPVVPTKEEGPFAGEAMMSRRRPDDQDWGIPLSTDRYPDTRADVAVAEVRPDPRFPETSIDISIRTEGADQPIASDIRINRLQDMAGHDFLAQAPWKPSDYLFLSLTPGPESSEPRYGLSVWTTGKVQGSGVYRLAFGSNETTVTLPGRIAPTDGGTPIDLGVVRLLPQRTLSDSIEFKVEGNRGLVRKITALDADGKVLGSDTPGVHPFFSRGYWLYVGLHGKPDEIRQWKITYFRQASWIERPFEFSVDGSPEPANGSRRDSPSDSKSTPADSPR